MKETPKPPQPMNDIITACVSGLTNNALSTAAINAIPTIQTYSNAFNEKMEQISAFELSPHPTIYENFSKDDIIKLYKTKFSKKGHPARIYYDHIKLSAHDNICPVCGVQIVSTLDHYFAKTQYPTLALSPCNLIPACSDCNKNKGDIIFTCAQEMPLHPYYDSLATNEWLIATINAQDGLSIHYDIHPNLESVSSILYQRSKTHLKLYKLDTLYSLKAAEDFHANKYFWQQILSSGTIESVQEIIQLQCDSVQQTSPYHWRSAFYRALLSDEQTLANLLSTAFEF